MTEWAHPAAILIVGSFLVPFLRGGLRKCYLLALPSAALVSTIYLSPGNHWTYSFLGNDLIFGRVDKLSLVFAYVFTIMAFIGNMYALHVDDNRQHVAALMYAGSSLGVVFAGDLLTLFIFWEIMAFASAYLIFARFTERAKKAGFRYLLVHLFGGVVLLAGIIMHYVESGSLLFGPLGDGGLAFYLILIGFILNAAVPPLSAWLSDAYPEATITGSVFLCAFTTKTAIYVLIRGFPGTEILVPMGVFMTLYGVVYAVLENDCRRLLAYHIISQVGYMVTGVGMGTYLALNGATAHAFTHIIYKALLFMGAGSVVYMTGLRRLTDMGGLYRTMPVTMVLYMIGGFSISAFPLFSGFVSKSMVVSAAAYDHRAIVTLLLTAASTGTFLSTTLKLPYFMFFGKDSGIKAKEPPLNMLVGMGIAAFLCVAMGVYPSALYNVLPYLAKYKPYTADHITGSLGLLLFTALGFFVLLKKLNPEPTISMDTDWFYRKGASIFMWFLNDPMLKIGDLLARTFFNTIPSALIWFSKNPLGALKIAADTAFILVCGSDRRAEVKRRIDKEKAIYPGDIIKHWPIGSTVLWVTIFLLTCLLIYYV